MDTSLEHPTWAWNRAAPKGFIFLGLFTFVAVWLGPGVVAPSFLPLLLGVWWLGHSPEDQQILRMRRPALFGLGSVAVGLALLIQISTISQASPHGGLAIFGMFALWAAVRMPHFLAGAIVFWAAQAGGQLVLFAAPAIVLLAARSLEVTRQSRLGLRAWLRSIVVALVAFFLSFLVSNLGFGGGASSQDEPDSLVEATREPDSAKPSDNSFFEWLNRLLGREGSPAGSRPGDGFGAYRPPEPETNWLLVLAVAALFAALVGLAYYLWKKRSGRAGPGGSGSSPTSGAWSMERLERIGASVGRPRQQHEGALTYANALANHTGDERLRDAGPLISAQVFQGDADEVALASTIEQIEADPPQPPPAPPEPTRRDRVAERCGTTLASVRQNPRRAATAIGVVAIVGLGAWYVGTRTTDLALAYTTSDSGVTQRTAPPREVNEVLGVLVENPEKFHRWERCSSIEYNFAQDIDVYSEYSLVRAQSGFLAGQVVGESQGFWNDENLPYRQWNLYSDGEMYSATLDDEQPELIWFDMPPAAPPAPMPALDAILAALPEEREVSERIDPHGDVYARYVFERPVQGDRLLELEGWFPPQGLSIGDSLLDIWTEDGEIERVRLQSFAGTVSYWNEYRVSEATPSTLDEAFGVSCPANGLAAADGWMGLDTDDVPTPEVLDEAPAAVVTLLDIIADRPSDVQRWRMCSSWEYLDEKNAFADEDWVWERSGFAVDDISGFSDTGSAYFNQWRVGEAVWRLNADGQSFSPEAPTSSGPFVWRDLTDFMDWSYGTSDVRPPMVVDDVLELLGKPRSVSERIDRFGEGFTRYVFANDVDYDRFNEVSGGALHIPDENWPVTIDIWSSGDEVQRLRSQASEYEGELGWIEYVIVDGTPESLADLYVDADCPASALTPTGDWRGASLQGDS